MATHISKEKRLREKQKESAQNRANPKHNRPKHVSASISSNTQCVTLTPERTNTMREHPRELKRFTTEKGPVSNLKYTRGSIIYAEFSQTGEFYMHNRRPLVVIGMPIGFYGKVICCTTTSRNVPGIAARFYRDNGTELGGYPISTIVPYNLLPVDVNQIINTIGQLNPWTFREVDNAVAFHLGYSDEYPGYCAPGTGFYEEHLAVKYSYGRDYYDPNEIVEEDVISEPAPAPVRIVPQPVAVEEEDVISEEEATEILRIPQESMTPRKPIRERQTNRIRRKDLISILTDEEKVELLLATKPIVEIGAALGIQNTEVSRLRGEVIEEATNEMAVSRIKSLLRGTITNFGVLSDMDRAAITYYLPASILDLRPKDLSHLEKRIILYMNACGAKMRRDRIHPDSFYSRITSRHESV